MGLSADGWHAAELLRIKARILAALPQQDRGSAIECLTKALAFALGQSVLAFELRSAIDLAACSPETESAIRLGSC